MDLQPLQIDRSRDRAPARRAGASPWPIRLVVLAVLVGLGVVFWRPISGLLDRVRLPEVRVIQVALSSPLAASAVQGTAANGYVVARVRAALSADAPGRIVEMNVTEGSVVKKGDVVARLYSDEYRALFERAGADFALAQSTLESRKAAHAVSLSALERARAAEDVSRAELLDSRASLDLAELELERSKRLVADKIAAQERLDTAVASRNGAAARVAREEAALTGASEGLRTAELEVVVAERAVSEAAAMITVKEKERDQALATLDKTAVRAPFDGVVVLKEAEVGEVVSPNASAGQGRGSIATMVDPATFEVQVEVPETNLAAVHQDAPARIFLDAYPEHGYEGRVLRIWPTANRQKATVEVRVGFAQPDELLRPEMGARVVFSEGEMPALSESPPALLLPKSALVMIEGRPHAFVVERDVARLRPVAWTNERSGRVVVEQGLQAGDVVIDSPPATLDDGDRVRFAAN